VSDATALPDSQVVESDDEMVDASARRRAPMFEPPIVPEVDATISAPFGRASERPYHRRGSDWLRLLTGVAVLAWLVPFGNRSSSIDQAVIDALSGLPSGLDPLFEALRTAWALWGVLLLIAVVVGRRWRLARDLVLAAAAGFFMAAAIGAWETSRHSVPFPTFDLLRHTREATFPDLRTAVLVAVVSTATPYVGQPMRRVGHAFIVATCAATATVGAGRPKDVIGAVVLGWVVAAGVHLAFGSPGGRPTPAQLAVIMRWLGVRVTDIELADRQPPDATVFLARDADGLLRIEVIGRDEVEAQLLARGLRYAFYRDAVPPSFTRLNRVEHEACMTLMAREAGVAAPRVIYAGRALAGAVLIVGRQVEGPTLFDIAAGDLSDELLDQTWEQVRRLHAARLTHGNLNGDHVVMSARGPTIVDFSIASSGSFHDRSPADVAELLATIAGVVGHERAVASCARVLRHEVLASALPLLQTAAMSRATRDTLPGNRRQTHGHLGDLREAVAAELDIEPPQLQSPYRIKASSLFLALGGLVAVAVLLAQLGDPTEVLRLARKADALWLIAAIVIAMATTLPYTLAFIGGVPRRLPLWASLELQVAMGYYNLAVPGVGGLAAQVRFLQREGLDTASAVAAGGFVSSAGGFVTSLGVFIVSVWLSPDTISIPSIHLGQLAPALTIAGVVLALIVLIVVAVPRLRRAVQKPLINAARTTWTVARSPGRLSLVLGGNIIVNLLYAACALACLRAFGGSISFFSALAIVSGTAVLSTLVPFPGGSTAVGALGFSGALVAFGVPQNVAVSTALVNQLVTSFVPAIPGVFATRHLVATEQI
jgi:tRNA A-37 threonylcarbamoyl transferase component Bud32/uncharacterized membrane protein YbhN (UPF0104 family)